MNAKKNKYIISFSINITISNKSFSLISEPFTESLGQWCIRFIAFWFEI